MSGISAYGTDFAREIITVRQRADRWNEMGNPKSAAGRREIPMTPMVCSTLREWKLACPLSKARLVIPNGRGNVESHANIVNRGLRPLQVKCGIVNADGKARYSLHTFRHFFASWLIEQAYGPKHVQTIMGHSSVKMTFDLYGHLFPSSDDDRARLAAGELALVGIKEI
ncbi:MAG: tyrosine-type recombinase/integrase [Geminicoccaceae bacterium]